MTALLPLQAPIAEPRALEWHAEDWSADVLRWCRRLCDGRASAEDAAQDVLMVLVQQDPGIRDHARLRRWLWGVTWRTVRAHRKRAWARKRVWGEADWMERIPGAPPPTERERSVAQVLDRLEPAHQTLLWLAYAEGVTRPELCDRLGLSEGTLNRHLTAARSAFLAAFVAGLALFLAWPQAPAESVDDLAWLDDPGVCEDVPWVPPECPLDG